MRFNGGFLLLSVIVLGVCILGGMLIQMPFEEKVNDDADACVYYSIKDITEKVDEKTKKEQTYITYKVINHGYADCKIYGYNFEYKAYRPQNGVMKPYIYSPSNVFVKECPKGEVFEVTMVFDVITKGAEPLMFSPYYHVKMI